MHLANEKCTQKLRNAFIRSYTVALANQKGVILTRRIRLPLLFGDLQKRTCSQAKRKQQPSETPLGFVAVSS